MKIVITGGGTGGHLTIAKAIKEALNKRGISPIFIGSTYGQDRAWFEADEGWQEKHFFETSGVVNKKGFAKFTAMLEIFKATIKAREIFKTKRVDAVFSVGGYSAAPASFAAIMTGKKFYIHEQNAVMGRLNKLLVSKATRLFSSYHVYGEDAVSDYPVRDIYFDNARVREEIKTMIFLGGSQGASAINDFALSIAKTLETKKIKIIHQCGKKDLQSCQSFYRENNINADVFDFSDLLQEKIKEADFAICRAGASTVWELTASQLPALFVPYPYAAGNHQYHNALFLVENALGMISKQEDLKSAILEDILSLDIQKMSKGLSVMIEKAGAKKIVTVILNQATTSES